MLIALFILLFSSLTILSINLLKNASDQFNNFRLENAHSLARTLSKGSLDALVTQDYELLEGFVNSSIPHHYGAFAQLTRPNGQVIVSTDLDLTAKKIIVPDFDTVEFFKNSSYKDRPIIEVIHDINIGETHFAHAHIAYYTDKGDFNYFAQAKSIIFSLAFVLIFILTGTYFIISKLRNPIQVLIRIIERISYHNKIDLPSDMYKRNDEVGTLARSFDRVFSELLSVTEEVQDAKEHLEARVERRTSQLEEKNIELDFQKIRISAIMDNAGDSIITVNKEGIIKSFNISALKLFGYEPDEIKNKNIRALTPPLFYKKYHIFFKEHFKSTPEESVKVESHDAYAKRKDGSVFPIDLKINYIHLQDESLFIGIVRDITFEKQAKEKLLKTKEVLEEKVEDRTKELHESNQKLLVARDKALDASKFKSQFISNISHELRTPLHAITAYENLLSTSELTEKQTKYCHNIKTGSDKLLEIITDILDFSSFESEQIDIEELIFSIKDLLQTTCDETQAIIKDSNIKFSCFIDNNLPPNMYTDPELVKQVIHHLVSNAIKYTDTGSIQIQASLIPPEKDKNNLPFVKVKIIDSGIGIEASEFDKIFDAFYQVDGSATRAHGGTGLGLTMSKKIIESMGGEILLESEVDVGSKFSIFIPIKTEKQ